jgi:hypothetical protein
MNYKVGDKLKWRGVFNADAYTVGKEYEIAKEYRPGHFYITDDNVGVEDTSHTWPGEDIEEHFERGSAIRTITRREILPGTYGIVQVGNEGSYGVLAYVSSSCGYSAEQLRAAAVTFNDLADALDDNAA